MKSIIYVGIDVHKATFSACAYVSNCQQFYAEETFQGNTAKVLEYLQMLKKIEKDIMPSFEKRK